MLNQSNYEHILIDKRDGVAELTLNRPERLNAVNDRMHFELTRIFQDAQADAEVRAIVLTGAGRGFCAGGDFSAGRERGGSLITPRPSGLTMMQEARKIVDGLLECEKPIVAAINGPAVGLGATIALLCDVVFAGRGARIGDPHVRMGITAGDGGAVIWPLLVGVNRAKQMLMTGKLISGEEAHRLGLVNELRDDAEMLDAARTFAGELAGGPAFAIQSSKVAVNAIIKAVSNLVLPLSLSLEAQSMATSDHREAVAAFQEKREPRFTGN